uniref:IgGFc-binding protein-like n=1 Tax=Pogona vitticeps TaxID=103695 RepID=A0ABM5ES84_9SAUR
MECKMINGQPTCVPVSNATCWAWGDPHYHTFDGVNYDFQGTCTYTIAKTRNGGPFGLPSFHIQAKNENRGNKRVSYVGWVSVEVYGFTITIRRSEVSFVRVNGIKAHLPISLSGGKLTLTQSGNSVLLVTEFQLRVSYDWNHHLLVTVTSAYHNGVHGLCGNYNGNPGDDFETPAGIVAPDAIAFGESWVVKVENDLCWNDCHGPCEPCRPDLAQQYQSENYCGLVVAPSNGPFSPCHSKVDPKPFFENCVYDVCANEGHKQTLCDALKTYADACQREGVQVGDWRRPAGCPLECPPNSEYQLCGTACPATCADDHVPSQLFCPAVCVEGCQCVEGFVLSQGACVPISKCGCFYDGRPYGPSESFWADDACTKRCVCNPSTRQVECTPSSCKTSEQCGVQKGVRGCYPVGYGNCSATGDPHYLTFDNLRQDFQGACAYVLTEVYQKASDLEGFSVYVQNEYRGNRVVTWTRSVQVNVFDVEIIVSRQYPGKILVGGLLTFLPYTSAGGHVKAYKSGMNAVVETQFGLTVTFNWDSRATVSVPTTYMGTLRGLCGNFNGIREDDAFGPGSIIVPSIPVFGGVSTKEYDSTCLEVLDPKCPGMEALAEQQRASGRDCGILLAKDGPFRECHGRVDQEGAFQDCVYDYCFFEGHYAFVCAGIASYAAACQAAGVTVYPWRSSTFCRECCHGPDEVLLGKGETDPNKIWGRETRGRDGVDKAPPCVPNSHYEVCAQSCGQSCASLYAPVTCPAQCEEDCVCDEGFVLSGHDCVPIARCGCFYQGRYYPALTTFHPKCEERCQCQPGGNVVCEVLPCGPNEECKLVNGVQKCHPTGNATCSVVGGLYLSFDGLAYTFQGTCTYILTKLQEKNVNLEPITVSVENEAWANGEIIVPKVVHVEVFGVHLTLLRNIPGQVLVDGVFYYLPVNLLGGNLRIYQHGISVGIHTSLGFAVSYDLFYHVRVTLPNTYTDQMRGLCGNYNGQKEDDLQLPDGTVVSDVAVFGAAWKIPIPGVSCVDGCSGSLCPVCAEGQQELFKQPGYCGLLTLPEGPFAACHAVLDPTEYLNNCIHELCVGGGDKAIACQSIQSYVTACQAAKVIIQPWRSLSFCCE